MSVNMADKTTYYTVHDNENRPVTVPLERHPRLLAVKLRPGRLPLSASGGEVLADLRRSKSQVDFIPHYGIGLYATGERDRAVGVLDAEAAVEFATPVFRQTPGAADPMIATRRFLVQFQPQVTRAEIDALNARYGVQIVEPLDYAPNGYALEAPPGDGGLSAIALANVYLESGLAVFSHPAFIRTRRFRAVATPEARAVPGGAEAEAPAERSVFLAQQWHLATAKVQDAWSLTRGSRSITVAILDDGFDVGHPEFAGKVVRQFDFASNDADASPGTGDDHGTACAGVSGAAGVKAFGAAPDCSLMLGRAPRALGVDDEARMFLWAADNGADVISCSWGPPDGTGNMDPLPDNVRAAIRECVRPGGRGRAGKGIPVFFAAGNGNESVSLDGYASNPDVMAVAASTSEETKAWYSDFGPEIWVCAPSNGGQRGIFTTDRRGGAGYNGGSAALGDPAGDYTNDFGGTSSATPLVAGIAALVLSANPALTRDQVRQILKDTADKIGSGYVNGHSPEFGYGRVNALRAVESARATGTGTPSGGAAAIVGPGSWARAGGPPTFQIQTGANGFYAVEVATRADLFNRAVNGGQRTTANFFASWSARPYLSGSTYALPADAWERLKGADRLFYRLWTTASATDWVSSTVTVPDGQPGSAPSIELTGQGRTVRGATDASGGARNGHRRPSIQTSDVRRRDAAPPTFSIYPGANPFWAVEITTDWTLFDRETNESRRDAGNFYGSYVDGGPRQAEGSTTYCLPERVWAVLGQASRLYYRLVTASAASPDWPDYETSTPDEEATDAPGIDIVRSEHELVRVADLVGPEAAKRDEEVRWRRR